MSIYVCQRMVKKIHHCTFRLKDFIHDFFYPKSCEKWSFHPSKILMTFFNLSTTNSGILLLFSNFPPHHTLFLYLFVIHHCKNRLSSLHIFVHHCTFCASVHVKTSPAFSFNTTISTMLPNCIVLDDYFYCSLTVVKTTV